MSEEQSRTMHVTVDAVYRSESRRVFATLIRLLGDFDAAEEALHEAFRAALEQWPRDGVPANPRAWLVSAGRFKAIVPSAAMRGWMNWTMPPRKTLPLLTRPKPKTSRTTGCA